MDKSSPALEYVRANIHTNSIEGFWLLLKRGLVGTCHKVRKDYMPLYLSEFTFRHNRRNDDDPFAELISNAWAVSMRPQFAGSH